MYLPNGLTEKQERFCNEYLVDYNATQAAIRSGYSEDTAYSIGWENLRKIEIKNRLDELKAQNVQNIDENYIVNKINTLLARAESENKLNDALKAVELLGKWKAMFTDKQIQTQGTIDDLIVNNAQNANNPQKDTNIAPASPDINHVHKG